MRVHSACACGGWVGGPPGPAPVVPQVKHFDELRKAYVVLNSEKLREAYDADLAHLRSKVRAPSWFPCILYRHASQLFCSRRSRGRFAAACNVETRVRTRTPAQKAHHLVSRHSIIQ